MKRTAPWWNVSLMWILWVCTFSLRTWLAIKTKLLLVFSLVCVITQVEIICLFVSLVISVCSIHSKELLRFGVLRYELLSGKRVPSPRHYLPNVACRPWAITHITCVFCHPPESSCPLLACIQLACVVSSFPLLSSSFASILLLGWPFVLLLCLHLHICWDNDD